MHSELNILVLQVVASFLMGFDYLFNERMRSLISANVRTGVSKFQQGIDDDIKERVEIIIQKSHILFTSALFLFLGIFVLGLMKYLPHSSSPWGVTLIALLVLFFIFGGAVWVLTIGMVSVVPIAIAIMPWFVTIFLLYCPKGIVFAFGFVILLLSFACRFSLLT